MRAWRGMMASLMALMLLPGPARAEHGPHFEVVCPTGTAQVVLDPGHGGPDPGAVHEGRGLHDIAP
jgi:N-acetylmuramoyl-L-alanine amidase